MAIDALLQRKSPHQIINIVCLPLGDQTGHLRLAGGPLEESSDGLEIAPDRVPV